MPKVVTRFVCRDCGAVQPRWMGKCPDCGAWDALEEHREAPAKPGAGGGATYAGASGVGAPQAVAIGAVSAEAGPLRRWPTGIAELDRVLGGGPAEGTPHGSVPGSPGGERGLVPGSAVLIGGDPGIGKSTLMLQAAGSLARAGRTALYVTSEESAEQLRLRAARLDPDRPAPASLYVLADTHVGRIVEQARRVQPDLIVIDSVQMVYHGDVSAAPGTVSQLRACCLELVQLAKLSGAAVLLVGHVTKQGALAGPRLLEHMVDAVLYFEGDRYHSHRVVRAVKNRFGTTLEVGLFEMTDRGLTEVADGASLISAEYQARSGSVICPVLQGSRCLLVEVQALTATGFLGSAKRKVSGLDSSRLAMLIAVLEKRGGLRLADQDVFASSVGGVKVAEPAADLAVALAIAGAHRDKSLPAGTCAFGEIGLGGEVRRTQQAQRRLAEAARLGFTRIITPPLPGLTGAPAELIPVRTLDEAMELLD